MMKLSFRQWELYIRKACVQCEMPKPADIKSAARVHWEHLGRVLEAKKQLS